ncbi:MAG: hypothetical protein J7604_03485 [Sporocytophaga sp.]|uniref:hypothetical protein n=1 Tax=Sporocytophaga sp. TaxID=2231183 RepID=UPI001B2EFA79|nr:hypothetical protein [Sporocytophaga sp.]MBO9699243.1 hypothetical protein [Sporocytophaga sp.]
MLQEILVQFKENFNQKVKTPFFGALIIVWSVWHWELLYSLFNFDEDCTRVDKIVIIKELLGNYSFCYELGTCLWVTFASLICTYILINFSRLITILFENHLSPLIYKLGDKSMVVTRADFEKEKRISLSFRDKYEGERKERLAIEKERDEMKALIGNDPSLENHFNELYYNWLSQNNLLDQYELIQTDAKHGTLELETGISNEINKYGLLQFDISSRRWKLSKIGKKFDDYFNSQMAKSTSPKPEKEVALPILS